MVNKPLKEASSTQTKVAIIGDGSWATALANVLTEKGNDVYWWVRLQDSVNYINRHHRNPDFLRSLEIHIKTENISSDLLEIISKADILFIAIPSLYLDSSLKGITAKHFKNKIVVSAVKGIIPHHHQSISEYFREHFKIVLENYVFLTGPSHAEEVANQRVTYLTLASNNRSVAETIYPLIDTDYIKIRFSDDVEGLEYATILKNIYAIIIGIAHSLGYGDNYFAVLTSNALNEMKEFLDKVCPMERNILSSAYLGDLMVTSFSQFSRNRTFGGMIGKGYSAESALIEMNMIPEGYYAVKSLFHILKKLNAQMPIVKAAYKILYLNENPSHAIQELEKDFI